METMARRRASMDGLIPCTQFPSHGMGRPVGIAYDSYFCPRLERDLSVLSHRLNYTLLSPGW